MSLLHTRTYLSQSAGALAFIALLAAGCSSQSLHESPQAKHTRPADALAQKPAPKTTTTSMQDDSSPWKRSPQMHAFYDATVATFAHGTDIDVEAYEAKSFAIFREFARANGANEQAMLDHLKLIPRQVVGIVKEDPKVLASYDNFWIAMVGPD